MPFFLSSFDKLCGGLMNNFASGDFFFFFFQHSSKKIKFRSDLVVNIAFGLGTKL